MNAKKKIIDKNISNLIAFLLSDGSMNFKKSKNKLVPRISLEVVNKPFCEKFQEVCKKVFGRTPKLEERHRNSNHSKSFRADLILSEKESEKLLKLVKTFRTKPLNGTITEASIPEEIMKAAKEIKLSFLRIFSSAEGSVHLHIDKQRKWWVINRWVSITCCHPIIHQQVKELLESVGIKAKSRGKDIVIKGKENLFKFKKLIGFIKGCKVTKKSHSKWEGVEKNLLLDLAIKLFQIDKSPIQKMNKEDIFLWLKSLLKAGKDG